MGEEVAYSLLSRVGGPIRESARTTAVPRLPIVDTLAPARRAGVRPKKDAVEFDRLNRGLSTERSVQRGLCVRSCSEDQGCLNVTLCLTEHVD